MSQANQAGSTPTRETLHPDTASNRDTRATGICIALAVAVLLVFSPCFKNDFINYDDNEYFTANTHVQNGLTASGVTWAFQTSYASNWHPLTWLSVMLDVELFGPGPAGPHFTNVLLHAANAVLLFLLLQRMTGTCWRSALVAALFALHPLHVESVAWASERKDTLSAFFGILALLSYVRYVSVARSEAAAVQSSLIKRSNYWSYCLSLLFFSLSLMSKPMLVTFPFILLLLDYWPLKRMAGNWRSTLALQAREKLPFVVVSAVSCLVTMAVQSGAVQTLDRISFGIRAVNAVVSYGRYLQKTLWPVNLAIPYPHHGYGSLRVFCLGTFVLLGVTVVAVWAARKLPYLLTGWFWFLGTLVPVIGLVQVGTQSMADRYTYLPLIGVFLMVVWALNQLLQRWQWRKSVLCGLSLLLVVACAIRTIDQVRVWRNSETLFLHAIAVTKRNAVAHYNLGEFYLQQGRLEEATNHFCQAITIRPSYDDALNNLGIALAKMGALDLAAARIQEAIGRHPEKADAHYNLGNVLAMQKKWDEAIAAYTEAIRLKPNYAEAHNNLANVFALIGRPEEAKQHYLETLRLNPGHASAWRQLQMLESVSGQQNP